MNRRYFLGAAAASVFVPKFGRWFPSPAPPRVITLVGDTWHHIIDINETGKMSYVNWLFFRPVGRNTTPTHVAPLFAGNQHGPLVPLTEELRGLGFEGMTARYRRVIIAQRGPLCHTGSAHEGIGHVLQVPR